MNNPKRADTSEKKRAVVEAILECWELMPHLRLGQLIDNARCRNTQQLFHVEDTVLVDEIREFTGGKL